MRNMWEGLREEKEEGNDIILKINGKEFKTRTPNQQQLWPPPCISDPDLDLQPSQYPSVTSVAGIDDAYNTANCTVSQPLAECLASAWRRKGKGWRKAREQISERWSREGGLVGSCSNQGGLLQSKLSENGMSTSAAELQPCLQRYPLMKGPLTNERKCSIVLFSLGSHNRF